MASLNKYTDFALQFDKNLASETIQNMSEIEFKITPEIVDNFISGIKISPDPLVFG